MMMAEYIERDAALAAAHFAARGRTGAHGRLIDADAVLRSLPDDLPYKDSVRRVLIQAPTADAGMELECQRKTIDTLLQQLSFMQETLQAAGVWMAPRCDDRKDVHDAEPEE
jgi:hypothetical protein